MRYDEQLKNLIKYLELENRKLQALLAIDNGYKDQLYNKSVDFLLNLFPSKLNKREVAGLLADYLNKEFVDTVDVLKARSSVFLENLKNKKLSLGTYLSEAKIDRVVGLTIIFIFPKLFKFHCDAVSKKENVEIIEQTLLETFDVNYSAVFILSDK